MHIAIVQGHTCDCHKCHKPVEGFTCQGGVHMVDGGFEIAYCQGCSIALMEGIKSLGEIPLHLEQLFLWQQHKKLD